MDRATNNNSESVTGVMRTMAILDALGEVERDCGVSEIAQKLDMSKSTVYRFLQTLKSLGYVVQDEDDRYRLSVRLFELGAKSLPQLDLVREADPAMRHINALTGESVHLGILEAGNIVYVHKLDSSYNLRMYSRIGLRAPLYCTGIGKVLMAWLDESEVLKHLEGETFQPRTANTLPNIETYIKELAEIRANGYGEDREEFETNMRCLSVPVFNRMGVVIAGMSVSFPCFRFQEDLKASYVRELLDAGRATSQRMGCPPALLGDYL